MSTGLDVQINQIRQTLEDKLWTGNDYTAYGRAFRIVRDEGMYPKVFHAGREYDEVLTDDNLDAGSFFDVLPERPYETNIRASVDIYFWINLRKIFPLITTYRPEEDAIGAIETILKLTKFHITGIITTIEAFDLWTNVKMADDMTPWFLLRFTGEVDYKYQADC